MLLLYYWGDRLLVDDRCFCCSSVGIFYLDGEYYVYLFGLSGICFLCCCICNDDSCDDVWFEVNLVVVEVIIMIINDLNINEVKVKLILFIFCIWIILIFVIVIGGWMVYY